MILSPFLAVTESCPPQFGRNMGARPDQGTHPAKESPPEKDRYQQDGHALVMATMKSDHGRKEVQP